MLLDTCAWAGSTSVSGPGQKASASLQASVEDFPRPFLHLFGAGQMNDQRVAGWPALECKNLGHGLIVARIGRQPVNGFGRQREQLPGVEPVAGTLWASGQQRHGSTVGQRKARIVPNG